MQNKKTNSICPLLVFYNFGKKKKIEIYKNNKKHFLSNDRWLYGSRKYKARYYIRLKRSPDPHIMRYG